MAGTRWAAQLAFAIPALLLLAPAALWVGLLGPFLHRHHPLPPAARRRALEARLRREGAWPLNHQHDDNGSARGSIVPPPDRALELALLTEPAAADGEPERNPHHDAGMCEWDWPWLRAQLEPALAQLRPLVRLDPVMARLVPPAHVLPPGLAAAAGAGAHAPSIIPTSALGTLGAHLDEAVLGPPPSLPPGHAAETEGRAPLRLVVACPAPGRGRHGGAAASFVEDGLGGSSGSGDAAAAAAAASTAVTIDGWGGVLLLAPDHQATGAAGSRMALLSEAAHVEVVGFMVAALRRWVLGEAAEGPPAVGEEGKRSPLLALTAAELGALVTRATKARAWEALRRVRVLQEEVIGAERPPLTPVPKGVARNVANALASLERLADGLAAGRNNATIPPDASDAFPPALLLHHASAALRAALRAESDPGLLAPPHLPLEHYAATLLPLLLPVLLPLLVGLGKERRRLREKRAGGGGRKGRKLR